MFHRVPYHPTWHLVPSPAIKNTTSHFFVYTTPLLEVKSDALF